MTNRSLNAQFGIASFIDKPIRPFGDFGDFVYRTDLSVTNSRTDLINTVNSLTTNNGVDFPEAQLEALQQIGLRADGEVGYRDQTGASDDPQRFLVLSTDATFHVAPEGPGGAPPNNGDTNIEFEDYPSIAQVKSALQAANIFPIFSVFDQGGSKAAYTSLVTELGFGAVVDLSPNSDNLVNAIISALEEIRVDVDPEVVSNTTGLDVELDPDFIADVLSGTDVPLKVTASASDDYRSGQIEIEVNGQPFQTIDVDIPVQTLNGTDGRDRLTGSNGPDLILAGARADIINAGGGDDVVEAGLGSNQVTLGKGNDIYVLDTTLTNADFFLGSDYILDFASEDIIKLRGIAETDLDVVVSDTDTLISANPSLGFIPEPLVTLAGYTGSVTFVEV